jgi:hypothetical protein
MHLPSSFWQLCVLEARLLCHQEYRTRFRFEILFVFQGDFTMKGHALYSCRAIYLYMHNYVIWSVRSLNVSEIGRLSHLIFKVVNRLVRASRAKPPSMRERKFSYRKSASSVTERAQA